jgi:hypothetical protein
MDRITFSGCALATAALVIVWPAVAQTTTDHAGKCHGHSFRGTHRQTGFDPGNRERESIRKRGREFPRQPGSNIRADPGHVRHRSKPNR